ncbi:hydrogen/calcium exchanger domain-containing protein [Aspergillus saccharolyticus JOP 1030-1]|uniref:Vacuolar calcium ion transporter n=1 Tax=Aspergillus saccharolyticus JOP 1030-1 TaxID=1450539 RepID=A0A319ASL8_9EURO|nr:putative sodium/calcium transporter [Aspergillus saccharolyticus JOP 1030-1]PYH49252.1 putative sodium/calcium transporter [Aspergillus saccharolyticus JOP 1030-1]
MHIYRRQARKLAWYDNEGEPSTHNPFKKFRARPRRTNSIQLENRLTPVVSEGGLRLSEERRRRRDMTQGLAGPEHADTFPPQSAGTDHLNRVDSAEKADTERSLRSQDPINVPQSDQPDETRPRKRRTFLNNTFHSSADEDRMVADSSKDSMPDKQKFTAVGQLKATLFNSWINVLLFAAPVGIALNYVDVPPVAVFVVNFIAIIPLAAMLSYATEEIAMRTGETIGGLLNATFGNAVELIVAIIALVDGEVVIVQTSLIGSMLSNLLLVMGMCFFFGGIDRLEQHFNPVVAQTAASLLALAVASLIIPTAFHAWSDAGDTGIAELSRGTSVILLVVYGCYLFFQLKSHTEIYNAPSPKVERRRQKVNEGDASRGLAQIGKMTASMAGEHAQNVELQEPDDEEQPQLSIWVAILTLVISTVFVALCAEFMVDSIDALTEQGNISETFVGLILLPIVGNAAEHATAVTVACKDKMDLAIGVAVGSSMQIALLVLPLIIVIGWGMGNDDMTLYFDAFQVILLFVAVLLVNYLIADGKSHWLEGVLLMMMYLIIAVAAWFYPSKTSVS